MGKSEQYNASVNFGASIDPSLGRTLKALTSGIGNTEKTTLKAMSVQTKWMKDLETGSASAAKKLKTMEQSMGALVAKQTTLEKKIRDGVRAGKDVSELAGEYKKVAAGISLAEKELKKLSAERDKVARREKRMSLLTSPTRGAWGRLKAMPGSAVDSGFALAGNLPGMALKGLIAAPVALVAGSAGLVGGAMAINKGTAEEYAQSQHYGMDYHKYKTRSILMERAGLTGENYGDLGENLTNNLGSMSSKQLNILLGQAGTLPRLLKGNHQQKVDRVISGLINNVRAGRLTSGQAESVADQLMGGEANKTLTYLLSLNKSYAQILADTDKLNNISSSEAAAASQSTQTISQLWTSAQTAIQGLSGDVAGALQKPLQLLVDKSTAWINENKKSLSDMATKWIEGGGPERLIGDLKTAGHGLSLLGQEALVVGRALSFLIPDKEKQKQAEESIKEISPTLQMFSGGSSPGQIQSPFMQTMELGDNATEHTNFPDRVGFNPDDFGGPIPSLPDPQKQGANVTHNQTFNLHITLAPGSTTDMAQDLHEQMKQLFSGSEFSPTYDINW